jgi:hypothetical protein
MSRQPLMVALPLRAQPLPALALTLPPVPRL